MECGPRRRWRSYARRARRPGPVTSRQRVEDLAKWLRDRFEPSRALAGPLTAPGPGLSAQAVPPLVTGNGLAGALGTGTARTGVPDTEPGAGVGTIKAASTGTGTADDGFHEIQADVVEKANAIQILAAEASAFARPGTAIEAFADRVSKDQCFPSPVVPRPGA
jgi:hypothetical protein